MRPTKGPTAALRKPLDRVSLEGPPDGLHGSARLTFLPAVGHGCSQRSQLAEATGAAVADTPSHRDLPRLSSGLAGGTEARTDPPPPGLPAACLPPRVLSTSAAPQSKTTLTNSPCAPPNRPILHFPEILHRARAPVKYFFFVILCRKCPASDYISQQPLRRARADNLRLRRGGNSCPESRQVLDSTRSLAAL